MHAAAAVEQVMFTVIGDDVPETNTLLAIIDREI